MPDVDTTQLEAVNTMLSLIGEAPVNSLTTNVVPDVALAIRTLEESNRHLQMQGWHWNRDQKVTITPDSEGRFAWQTDWIRFNPERRYTSVDIVKRGDYLWDAKNSTDKPAVSSLEGEVIRFLGWDDLPESARAYIMIRAGRIFISKTQGGSPPAGYERDDENRALAVVEEEEADQSEANYFDQGPPADIRRNHW